jgi:hypothetical protein
MICLACAEALGLIDRPKPQPAPEARPLIEIPSEPAPPPSEAKISPEITPAAPSFGLSGTSVDVNTTQPLPPSAAAKPAPEQVTVVTPTVVPPPVREPIVIDSVAPAEQQTTGGHFGEPELAPKSAASETVVSQRGNTLQVPKVAPTLGKPPAPIAKPRKAQRIGSISSTNFDWVAIGMGAGTIVMGILGILLILIAVRGG